MENDFGDFSPIFVFVAYAAVWIVFFGYLYYMARRQSDIRSQIDALREAGQDEKDESNSGEQ